jgi:murein DD-endopeptidase MepM/ murein hydrolase activator NlpD
MLGRVIFCALVVFGLASGPSAAPVLTIAHNARALKPGEVVVLTVASDSPLLTLEVKAFDRVQRAQTVRTTSNLRNWIALVGIDLDTKPGSYPVSIVARSDSGTTTATHTLTVTSKVFATRELKVDPNFVNPPEAEAARIARESAALNAAFAGTAGPDFIRRLVFVRPVPHRANSAFGTRSIFNGEPRNAHSGADFLSPAGTEIKAPAGGKVVLADNLYFSGGCVVVDHGMGVVSLFAHMSRILVKQGEDVIPGKTLGLVGATGRVTGPHLHWTVRVNGARVDPLSLLAVLKRE